MKRFLFPLLFLVFLLAPAISAGVVIDRVVAVVNDEVVTLSEIDEAEYHVLNNEIKGENPQPGGDRMAIKKEILGRFIERKLQLQEAERLSVKATDQNIKNAIEDIKSKNDIPGDEELKEALSLQGLTLENLRQQIIERIKIAKLINRMVRAKVQINEDDIRAYYQQHLVEYRLQEEIHARHILVLIPEKASDETVDEIRSRMEKIAAELENGADFAETAKKYSEAPDGVKGGDLGYFKKGQMIPEIERAVFSLQSGQRSGIVRTPFGFHIFEAIDRMEHTIDNDPDLRKEIEEKISRKKTEKRLEKFNKELKEKAFINIMEGS